MKRKAILYRGLSGTLWPLTKLTVTDDSLTLHRPGVEIAKSYDDIKYITVSWLGSIRFHFDDRKDPKDKPDDTFSFWCNRTPELLSTLTDKSIPAGGHVLRWLFISQLFLCALIYTFYIVLFLLVSLLFPSIRDDLDFASYRYLLIWAMVYAVLIAAGSVQRYAKGNYDTQTTNTKKDDWFPW